MIINKWNYVTNQYHLYKIPDDKKIVLYTEDMELSINCASCFKEITFGSSYTSRQLHSFSGFGYPVCEECYEKECTLDRYYG